MFKESDPLINLSVLLHYLFKKKKHFCRCRDEITQIDRAPCCRASRFPYTVPIFEKCLVQAIGDLVRSFKNKCMGRVACFGL
jgi:hypothetical protein